MCFFTHLYWTAAESMATRFNRVWIVFCTLFFNIHVLGDFGIFLPKCSKLPCEGLKPAKRLCSQSRTRNLEKNYSASLLTESFWVLQDSLFLILKSSDFRFVSSHQGRQRHYFSCIFRTCAFLGRMLPHGLRSMPWPRNGGHASASDGPVTILCV